MKKEISVVIIDDESDSQDLLSGLLREYYPNLNILGYSVNIDDAFELIKSTKPNLVYLDINLPRGSGVNLLERFPVRKFEVIVVSGYPENKSKLERFRDVLFLNKPVKIEAFKDVTDRALESIINDPYKVHRYD
jgi:two-component system LytT family response regulator